MSPVPSYLLETHKVGIRFGGLKAIDGVDFRLADGELRCLIGPNGAGKTTFFRLITGVHRPSSGSVNIDGVPIAGMLPHQVAGLGVGIKTQIPSLFEGLSVRENIFLAAKRLNGRRQAERVVDEVLVTIGLTTIAGIEVSQLSHGQRQSVELAVVFSARPKLMLLDEPAAGMTGSERERTADLIRTLNKTCAMIVVEHDMEFIKMIAKTVTVFNRGEILMEAGIDEVLLDQRVKDVYLGKQTAGVTL